MGKRREAGDNQIEKCEEESNKKKRFLVKRINWSATRKRGKEEEKENEH